MCEYSYFFNNNFKFTTTLCDKCFLLKNKVTKQKKLLIIWANNSHYRVATYLNWSSASQLLRNEENLLKMVKLIQKIIKNYSMS